MSRPAPGLASVGETLHRTLADPPAWASASTRRAAQALLKSLCADALAIIASGGPKAAAEALGVGRSTLARWREAGGWLCP